MTRQTSTRSIEGLIGFHFDELVVGHVGLGQQHVHVTGHAAGDGMNRKLHFDAALAQFVGKFAHLVLRLGHRHAVTGDDHDALRVGEQQAPLRRPESV